MALGILRVILHVLGAARVRVEADAWDRARKEQDALARRKFGA